MNLTRRSKVNPVQALRVPGCWGSQISRQLANKGGKVVSPTHRSPLRPRKYSWYSLLLRGWDDPRTIMRSEGLTQWQIIMTLSVIETVTFRHVQQYLNQPCQRVPPPPASNVWRWEQITELFYLSIRIYNSCRRLPETKRHSSLHNFLRRSVPHYNPIFSSALRPWPSSKWRLNFHAQNYTRAYVHFLVIGLDE
jgi:hypothetical protein